MKNRILFLTNSIAGLHTFRKEIVKAIVDAGYEVCISAPDEDERMQYFKEIGCNIVKTTFNRRGMSPMADIGLMLRYRKLIKRLKPKVVLSYTIKPNVYGGMACRLCGVPQLANVTGLGDAVENGGWLQKLTVTLYKWGIGKAKCVFFQNRTNLDFCKKNAIVGCKSLLLPGSGVNLLHHTFQDYPEDGVIRFLYISRVLRDKGADEFLEMAETVKAKYPQSEFQILGWIENEYKEKVQNLVDRGVIKYLGSTSDVRPFMRTIHCTVMPSYHEGMSNVNLESAANGRPVITTNVPGCRETVDDGVTGYLVEAKSASSLANAVERFISLPYAEKILMGKNARDKVEKEFDRNIVVNAYLIEIQRIGDV